MMLLVANWPKGGGQPIHLRIKCAAASDDGVGVCLMLRAQAQNVHGCTLARAHGVREPMWLIILIG